MAHLRPSNQSGQTLIETIVAIFVLTMALTTGLGLAIYAFKTSQVSEAQIVGSNLAREGIEIVRMMRDSNWLAGDAQGGRWALVSCADIGGKLCYPSAFVGPTYNIASNGAGGNSRLIFNSSNNTWSLNNGNNYDLYLQADGTYSSNSNGNPAMFARMINVSLNGQPPYDGPNPEMILKSVVAWRGNGCTDFSSNQDLLALSTPCKIVVEEHVTNWKDY